MKNSEIITEQYPDEEFVVLDTLEEAIAGVEETTMRIVYDIGKIEAILSRDMTPEEANEYYHYNIEGAYMGDKTPLYIRSLKDML